MLFKPELHNLKTLSFTSIAEGGALIENLHVLLDEFKEIRNFTNSLENLELNGSTLDTDGVHQTLNSVLMKLPNLKSVTLIGAGLGESLDLVLESLRQPKLRSIDLQLNGIERTSFATCFKWMLDFDNI